MIAACPSPDFLLAKRNFRSESYKGRMFIRNRSRTPQLSHLDGLGNGYSVTLESGTMSHWNDGSRSPALTILLVCEQLT